MRVTPLSLVVSALFVISLLLGVGGIQSAPPPSLSGERGGAPADEKRPAPFSDAPIERSEHLVYVPYDRLEGVMADEEKAVIMPYRDFLTLWGEITPPVRQEEEPPPVEATLTVADYTGRIEGNTVYFEGKLEIEALKEGWSLLPLPFGNVAFTDLSLSEGVPTFTKREGTYALVLPQKGAYHLSVRFVVPLIEEPGQKVLRFTLPPAPVSRVDLAIPAEGMRIRPGGVSPWRMEGREGERRVRILPSEGGRVELLWSPEIVTPTENESRIFVSAAATITLREGLLHNETTLRFDILQAPTGTLTLHFPKGTNLLDLRGKNIKRWGIREGEETQELVIDLFEKIIGHYELGVELEGENDLDRPAVRVLPFVHVAGAVREKGIVAIRKDAGLKVVPQGEKGLVRIPFSDLPEGREDPHLVLAYRYRAAPIELRLAVIRRTPRIETIAKTHLFLEAERARIEYALDYDIREAGIFHTRIEIPQEALVIRSVTDRSGGDAIEDYRIQRSKGSQTIEIDFRRIAFGETGIRIMGEIQGARDEITLPLPRVEGARRERGWIGVDALDKLKVRTLAADRLIPVSAMELSGRDIFPKRRAILGFRYEGRPPNPRFGVEARAPKVTAEVWNRIEIAENLMKVEATVHFDIRYAGVATLSVAYPAAIESSLHISGEEIKEKRIVKREGGAVEVVTEIVLQRETIGDYVLRISYEQELPPRAADTPLQEVRFLPVRVPGVEREEGVIALLRDPTLEITTEVEGLERIDPKELPPAMPQRAAVFRSFRYLAHPYRLTLRITKHEYGRILSGIINRMHLESVVSRETESTTELTLEMQNKSLQYLVLEMPPGSTILTLFVDGRGERASVRASDGRTLIPLNRVQNEAGAFYVRMVYRTRLAAVPREMKRIGRLTFVPPDPIELPIQKFTWRFYLPDGFAYLPPKGELAEMYPHFRSGWGWGIELAGKLVPALGEGREYRRDSVSLTKVAAAGDQSALSVSLVKEGVVFDLYKLYGTGRVHFRYLDRKLFGAIAFGFFLLPVLFGWFFVAQRGYSGGRYLCAAAVVVAVALAFSERFYRSLWGASALGTVLYGFYLGVPGLLHRLEAWRGAWMAWRTEGSSDSTPPEGGAPGGKEGGGTPAAKSPDSSIPSPLADEGKGGAESTSDRMEKEESS